MNKAVRLFSVTVALLSITAAGFADEVKIRYTETDVTIKSEQPYFSFVSYGSIGSGTSFVLTEELPAIEASSGFQIAPWIAVGAFCAVNPLSNFEHAYLGLNLADREAAYAMMTGTEIILTPRGERWIHPLLRFALGGVNVGYLENIDNEEGYDRAHDNRYFFASISTGLEMNLSNHFRLALRGGWRFVENEYTLGIGKGELSGPEVTLTVRALWKTVID